MEEENVVENPLEFSMKKKKKKGNMKMVEVPKPVEKLAVIPTTEVVADLPDFGGKKKKKTQKTVTIVSGAPDAMVNKVSDDLDTLSVTMENIPLPSDDIKQPVGKTPIIDAPMVGEVDQAYTPNYSYDFLLNRVFSQIKAKNPELMSDQKRRLVMVPPSMARVGTKKTQFTNFNTICRLLCRDPVHLSAYMFAELGTTGSLDANGALLIRGRYQSKHIEPVLRTYARMYVLCSTCQSPETDLCKDSRLLFLKCRHCGSRITVKSVTTGFQAVTGKRAAMRAKAQ